MKIIQMAVCKMERNILGTVGMLLFLERIPSQIKKVMAEFISQLNEVQKVTMVNKSK